MADPATLAAIFSGGASLLGGISGYQSGKADAAQNKFEAQQALATGEANAARQRQLVAFKQSQLRAQVGAQGSTMEGSPMEVYLENAKQGELEAQDEIYVGRTRAQAKNVAAAQAKRKGAGALFGGILGAGAALSPLLYKNKNP